jgi:hypothetical protein
MRRSGWLVLAVAVFVTTGTVSLAQINSYVDTADGFWDEARHWSLAAPPSISQSAIFITNDISKTVTIDSITAGSFPDTLTISNLTISATSAYTNTLALTGTGATALHILNGLTITSGGGMTSTNATLVVDGVLDGQARNDGVMVFTDSLLVTTNCTLQIAANTFATGRVTVVNSIVQAGEVIVAGPRSFNRGTFDIIGGKTTLLSSLEVGKSGEEARGVLTVKNGGLLVVTNATISAGNGGANSSGSIVVSNATLLAAEVKLGPGFRATGTLTLDSGTVTLNGALLLGSSQSAGIVSVKGGVFAVTNAATIIGAGPTSAGSVGNMTISGGMFLARELLVGAVDKSVGTLTVNGGTALVNSNLEVGSAGSSSAYVFLSGGQLLITNGNVSVTTATAGQAVIKLSNGYFAAKTIDLGTYGSYNDSAGTLSTYGGSMTVSAGITLGKDCMNNHAGFAFINGGQSFVTNSAADAFIDVRNGRMEVNNGSLTVDKLVMTNSCGEFIHAGGTLIVGSLVLDPNAFRIASVAPEGNDLRITWLMGPGATNALQVAAGAVDGSYETNNFTDIFVVTNNTTPGTITNYLDVGAASSTNTSRFYRARLVP